MYSYTNARITSFVHIANGVSARCMHIAMHAIHCNMTLSQCSQGTDESQVAGDNFRAIRPTFSPQLNWTAGHSSYELSLSDAEASPCEVFAAAWEQGDHQKWKIVSQHVASQHAKARQVMPASLATVQVLVVPRTAV